MSLRKDESECSRFPVQLLGYDLSYLGWFGYVFLSFPPQIKVLQTTDGSTSIIMLAQLKTLTLNKMRLAKHFQWKAYFRADHFHLPKWKEFKVWHVLSSICNLHSEVQPLAAHQPERFFGSQKGRTLRDVVRMASLSRMVTKSNAHNVHCKYACLHADLPLKFIERYN